jgi:hypothetical protein
MKDIKNFTESIISHYDMTDEKLKEINNKLIQFAIKDKLEVLEGVCVRQIEMIDIHQKMVNMLRKYCEVSYDNIPTIIDMIIKIVVTGGPLMAGTMDMLRMVPDVGLFKDVFELWQIAEMRKVELEAFRDEMMK